MSKHEGISVEVLAREFDATFASAPTAPVERVALLAIGVDSEPLALRIGEVESLHAAPRIVRLPSKVRGLSGLVGIRGRAVPVYDLATLLGRESTAARRWIVLTGTPVVGVAFSTFEGQLRTPVSSVVKTDQREPFVRELATVEARVLPVLDLGAIHAEITRTARTVRAKREE